MRVLCQAVLLVACLFPVPTIAQDSILGLLAEPRTHAIMRHALAPGSADPENFDLKDCSTQRNLSADGVRQAGRAGDMLRAAGAKIDLVWSSQWCRCLDTAREMDLGQTIETSALNSFSTAKWKAKTQTKKVQQALAELAPEVTAIMVTHNVNAEALSGVRPISGEIQIVRLSAGGRIELLGSVRVPVF